MNIYSYAEFRKKMFTFVFAIVKIRKKNNTPVATHLKMNKLLFADMNGIL